MIRIDSLHTIIHSLHQKLNPRTASHCKRVAYYSLLLGKALELKETLLNDIYLGGLLHDIGKIGIREEVLYKNGSLSMDEYVEVKHHPIIGEAVVSAVKPLSHLLPMIRHHHERMDGMGYPGGLKGENIPLGARIITIVDSFDAMTTDRVYRSSLGVDQAVDELVKHSGTQFDPHLVSLFIQEVIPMVSGDGMAIKYATGLEWIHTMDSLIRGQK